MITEIYVKGRCDFGKGRYAVVIVEAAKVIHQVAFAIGKTFPYNGQELVADQYNSEIVAACYGLQWCKQYGSKLVNIYSNNNICQKWYYRKDIPNDRILRDAYLAAADGIDVYADYIPKNNTENEFNVLVNNLAENAR